MLRHISMQIIRSCLLLLALMCLQVHSRALRSNTNQLQCWEMIDFTGDSVTISNPVDDFGLIQFDDKASSCCATGIWLLYENTDFNAANPGAEVEILWGQNVCKALEPSIAFKTSSASFAGSELGYKFDTITVYTKEHFAGQSHLFTADESNLHIENLGMSLIITGIESWTLYEKHNFHGESVCIIPTSLIDLPPNVVESSSELAPVAAEVGSIRRGCWSSNSISATPIKN